MPSHHQTKAERNKAEFLAAMVLLAAFNLYCGVWLVGVIPAAFADWRGTWLGYNVHDALSHMSAFDLGLFFALSAIALISLILLALRRRAVVPSMAVCVVAHLVFWIRMTDNPVYNSPIVLIIIAIEVLILLLTVRLALTGGLR